MNKLSDCWQTPDWLFDELDAEFDFSIDLCATEENSKCGLWCSNYLENEFVGFDWGETNYPESLKEISAISKDRSLTCFINPPYSNPRPFIEKAWEDAKFCRIVALVKCDPSTKWWATFWNYQSKLIYNVDGKLERTEFGGPKPGCEVRFFPKRIPFEPPAGMNLEMVSDRTYRVKCDDFSGASIYNSKLLRGVCEGATCKRCKGTGYRIAKVAGGTFPCALLIFDRRGLCMT